LGKGNRIKRHSEAALQHKIEDAVQVDKDYWDGAPPDGYAHGTKAEARRGKEYALFKITVSAVLRAPSWMACDL